MTNLTKICIKNKKQNITINANKLLEYIKKVENGENIPDIKGVTITKIEENGEIVVVDVDVEGVINGDLDIEGTKVRKIKAKNIWGHINAEGVETLEEIEVEEEIDVKEDEEDIERDFHINIKKNKSKNN